MKSGIKSLRYAMEAIVVYSFYYFSFAVGIRAASAIGGIIARIIGPRLKITNLARKNIKYAMPHLSSKEIEEIVIGMWSNLGRVAGELPHMRNLTGDKFWQHVEVENIEHLIKLRDIDKTGIVISGHFANWELAPKIEFEVGIPMTLIYRHANNPWVEKLIQHSRRGMGEKLFSKGADAARNSVRALRDGEFIGVLVDQKLNEGIEAKFFGKKAMTSSFVAEMAIRFNCPIVPIYVLRTKGVKFRVICGKPLITEGKDALNITQEINDLLEAWIRKNPAQWLWLHRRWPKEDVGY